MSTVQPRKSSYIPAAETVVVERIDPTPPITYAALVETIIVALSAGLGWVIAGALVVDLLRHVPVSLWGAAFYLGPAATLAIAGAYAVLAFGGDRWERTRGWMRTRHLEAMCIEYKGQLAKRDDNLRRAAIEMAALRNQIEQMQSERRGHAEPRRRAPEPRLLACVRIIISKWQAQEAGAEITYSRDQLVIEERLMSQGEWTAAMTVIEECGFVRKGGRGNKQKLIEARRADDILDAARLYVARKIDEADPGEADPPSPALVAP